MLTDNKAVDACIEHLDKFTHIYPKDQNWSNEMPENVKLTVFCSGGGETGFLINTTTNEMGLERLIARKWILHSDLEKLVGDTIE